MNYAKSKENKLEYFRNIYEMIYNRQDDEAIELLEDFIKVNPISSEAFRLMGLAYGSKVKRNYTKAIECFNKALQIEPGFAKAIYNMGNSFLDLKEYFKAIDCYEKAIVSNSTFEEPYYWMGFCYFQLEKYDLAIYFVKIADRLGSKIASKTLKNIYNSW